MRRLVVSTYVSLDGVTEAPEQWTSWSDQMEEYAWEQLLASDALLMGRGVYEVFAASWPSRGGEFADRMNSLPKFVVSTTLDEAAWSNTSVISGDVVQEVSKLKRQPGQNLLIYGSGELMRSLMQHDLIDEYRFWINPVVVGNGKRLFSEEGSKTALKLVRTTTFDTGVVMHAYQPAGKEG